MDKYKVFSLEGGGFGIKNSASGNTVGRAATKKTAVSIAQDLNQTAARTPAKES